MEPEDSIMLACIRIDLQSREPDLLKCFVSRDAKAFLIQRSKLNLQGLTANILQNSVMLSITSTDSLLQMIRIFLHLMTTPRPRRLL